MNISPEAFAEFKQIWIEQGFEYESDEQLREAAISLLSLFKILGRQIPLDAATNNKV